MNASPTVAVVYNSYPEGVRSGPETVSEEAVRGMAREVFECVEALGYRASLISLDKDILDFAGHLSELRPEVLVNLCEGFDGRPELEANVAAAFELLGLAFTGSGSKCLSLCQDKYRAKALLAAHSLPTARGRLVYSEEEGIGLEFPLIVKPNFEDASLGIYQDSVVTDEEGLRRRVRQVTGTYRQPALVEQFIDGREFNVAVFENGSPRALPVSEIDYSDLPVGMPRVLGYEAKWYEDHPLYKKTPPVCPAVIAEEQREKLQSLAVSAFKVMGCRDYARVDFRMDGQGQVFILEVNPNPDISLGAGYARALRAAGIEYGAFWQAQIENALRRKAENDPPDAR